MLDYLSKIATVWATLLAFLAILVAGEIISISASVEHRVLRPCLIVDLEKFKTFYKLKTIPKPLEFLIADQESKIFLIDEPSLLDFPIDHPFSHTKTFSLLSGKELMRGANPEGLVVPNTIADTKSILGLGHKTRNVHKEKPIGNNQLRAASFLFAADYLVQDIFGLIQKKMGHTLVIEEIEKIAGTNYSNREDELAFWNALRLSVSYVNFIYVKNISKVRAVNVRVLFDNVSRYALKPVTITGLKFGQFSYDPTWNMVSISELASDEQVVFMATALSAVASSDVEVRTDKFGEIDKNKLWRLIGLTFVMVLIICGIDKGAGKGLWGKFLRITLPR